MKQQTDHLYLAPMEGVIDAPMRKILSEVGGIDTCVTEFFRVSQNVISDKVWFRDCPEFNQQCKTDNGIPIIVQLLGGDASLLAENACRAVELGAFAVDLNFGCPAKTVNRHDGGATLLKYPDRLFNIVTEVRKQLPSEIPVSAKMRLGFEDPGDCVRNAEALVSAGINRLTIHARTKTDAYKPPAHWQWLIKIREAALKINPHVQLVANGDIFTVQDYLRCKQQTGYSQFMIGRGALRNPFIFLQIKNQVPEHKDLSLEIRKKVKEFHNLTSETFSIHLAKARTKQWLKLLSENYPVFKEIFDQVKIHEDSEDFSKALKQTL